MTMATRQFSSQKSQDDREGLVGRRPKQHSLLCVWGGIFIGVLFLSLAIYGFMRALDLKKGAEDSDGDEPTAQSFDETKGSVKHPLGDHCKPVDFGYLILAIRWSIGACESLRCVPQLQKEWLIHGLWPNYNNNSWPQYCCDSDKFDISKIQPLLPKLEKSWKNLLLKENSSSLWDHEWSKHGTCSYGNEKIRGEFKYFEHSLTLSETINVGQWLEKVNIRPGTKTDKNKLKTALRNAFGKNVSIHCVPEGRSRNRGVTATESTITQLNTSEEIDSMATKVLESVHFCYSPDSIESIDCPDRDSCPQTFLYPSQLSK